MGNYAWNSNNVYVTQGDDFTGTFQLRINSGGIVNPAPIAGYEKIEIHWPAFDPSQPVILSTANLAEITVVDSALSTIAYSGAAAKSALMNAGPSQKVDIVVTDSTGKQKTYTTAEIVFISQRANS